VVTVVFVLVMALLATWLVRFDILGAYVCAALLASMTLALAAVRPDRRWLHLTGVAIGLATVVIGFRPTDGGGYCGSVLHPGQGVEAYDSGGSTYAYFDACDDRATIHGVLVMLGSAVSGLLIGASLQSLRRGRRDASPTAEVATTTLR
jgi:hypothetical protein